MDQFWNAFIPLFVAFDPIGLLPVFWALTRRLDLAQRRKASRQAVVTAGYVIVGFLLVSRWIFALMGLQFSDLMIAGGAILIVLCFRDLLTSEEAPAGQFQNPGVVPIGVPLLAGPAAMTTVLLVKNQSGWPLTLAALGATFAVVWVTLAASEWLMARLGREGAQIVSRIASLVLTAFGVMLIRRGIFSLIAGL